MRKKKTRPCHYCGAPKKPGHPSCCAECYIARQPMPVQVADAQAARARFERRLAAHPDFTMKRPPKETWPEDRQWCGGCYRFRRSEAFGSTSQCRACTNAKGHASMVKREYDLSAGQYDAILKAQGGRCYICQRFPRVRRLAVDHDHLTGEVRGLLCSGDEYSCNHTLLSLIEFTDDPLSMAQRIVTYLNDPPARKVLDV